MDKTEIAVAVFDKRAKEYQDKFMDLSLYHDTFDLFCDTIATQNAAVLELACGPGNITRYLLEKRPDFQLLGTDLSPNMLHLAEINNPNAEFRRMDCRDIGQMGKHYDAIMCGFCFPYLSKEDAVKLIQEASCVLHPKGIIYISTMEDEYTKSGFKTSSAGDQIYIHYHQADYLIQALNEIGFKIINVQRKDFPTTDGTKTTDLVIIAQK